MFCVTVVLSYVTTNVYNETVADILGWLATGIFTFSRIPQIILNFQRKNVQGLSIYSFILVNIANALFLASILVGLCDVSDPSLFFITNLQWIMGTTLTVLSDIVIFYQFKIYG
jgi:uncharacterized protein with PQ loop repeat